MRKKKRIALLLLSVFMSMSAYSDNIFGTVKDSKTGEEIIGATIRIKESPTVGTTTNLDGVFNLAVDKLPLTLVCSYVGYETSEIYVKDASELKILLKNMEVSLQGVTVAARIIKGGESGMLLSIKNADMMQSGISAQQIQKTQDKDASEVVKRVAGISLQDNRFVMVRGLAQRYNNVWLNGGAAPSSEADSRAFSFDIIPSSQIDNMVVVKSPAPEYPSDFAGGLILLETKNIPSKNSFEISANVGMNSATTFSDFRYNKGSWSDILGFDGGLRNLQGGITSSVNYLSGSSEAVDLQKNGFNNDWSIRNMKALPDMSLSALFNRRRELESGALLGLVATLNWSNSYKSFTNMTNNLFGVYDTSKDQSNYLRNSTDNQYNQKSKLCSMLNLAYQSPLGNSRLEFKNMLNQLGLSRLITHLGVSAQSKNEQSESC